MKEKADGPKSEREAGREFVLRDGLCFEKATLWIGLLPPVSSPSPQAPMPGLYAVRHVQRPQMRPVSQSLTWQQTVSFTDQCRRPNAFLSKSVRQGIKGRVEFLSFLCPSVAVKKRKLLARPGVAKLGHGHSQQADGAVTGFPFKAGLSSISTDG